MDKTKVQNEIEIFKEKALEEINKQEIIDNDVRIKAQNFQKKFLHKNPPSNEIQTNTFANNSKYVPISFLEMNLDELFFGAWETQNFQYLVIANEIVGSLELRYFHPTLKIWVTRVGAGAVQIQMVSVKKGGSGDITNIKDKITNTLTKDFPHLKAECFRNACQSIGKLFGRDLNREHADQYQPILKKQVPSISEEQQKLFDSTMFNIADFTNPNELYDKFPNMLNKVKDKLPKDYVKILEDEFQDKYDSLRGAK